ncbi:MAG: YceI family protein [Casimicrobium sp.]
MKSFAFSRRSFLAASVVAVTLTLAACATTSTDSSQTAWTIDRASSNLHFVSTKAGAPGVAGVSEVSTFKRYEGGMSATGDIKMTIDLASIDSGIEIRDERLRTMLWNVKATPTATFTAKLGSDAMTKLSGSRINDFDVTGELQLAGQTKPVSAKLRTTRLGDNSMLVTTRAPIVINSNDYGLRAGVEALREVVGLNFVSASAPVDFALVLNVQK